MCTLFYPIGLTCVQYAVRSGGANRWPGLDCVLSVNPYALAVPREASRRHFCLLCRTSFSHFTLHSTTFHANRGQLFGAQGTRKPAFESKFSKIFRDNTPGPPCGRAAPFRTHPSATFCFARDSSTPVLGSRPPYPLRSYGAPHLCPSKNKLLVPPLTLLLVHLILYASPHHSP